MTLLKKFLTIVFVVLVSNTAAATEQNFVWATVPGGSLDGNCRTLWKEYDQVYNTATTVMPVKPGLSGGLAVEEFLNNNKANGAICIGLSQFFLNPLLYPGQTKEDQLEPIIIAARLPFIWYVPAATPAANYQELLKHFKSLNRPINVGAFIPIFSLVESIFKQHGIPVNIVPFKSSPQQYPSLSDGTLDLAFDAGAGLQIANQTKKFKN